MFIMELTTRAWIHAEDNKRRTLQRNDLSSAIQKSDQYDFLIDVEPRDNTSRVPVGTSRSEVRTTCHGAGSR